MITTAPPLKFRPPLWAWLLTPPMLALLCAFGTWQVGRGQDKLALQAAMQRSQTGAVLALAASTPAPADDAVQRGRALGRYDASRQLLLDNQSHAGKPGYQVLTPLRLESGGLLLVNRGSVAQNPDRRVLPAIDVSESGQEVVGYWRPLSRPGLRLAADNCAAMPWPRVVQYPTVEDLACLYGEPIAAGVLLLDAQAPDGYLRDWNLGGSFPPQRHYAYAAQWYMFAVVLLFFFVKLNLKRSP